MPAIARVLLCEVLFHGTIFLHGICIEAPFQSVKNPILQGFLCRRQTSRTSLSPGRKRDHILLGESKPAGMCVSLHEHGASRHLAMAPAKAVAAGRVCIALAHVLWEGLHGIDILKAFWGFYMEGSYSQCPTWQALRMQASQRIAGTISARNSHTRSEC